MKILAVDLGATSGRTIVVDYSNNKLSYEETSRFKHEIISKEGMLYWDIDLISKKVIEGIETSLKKFPDIASIGIDTWGVDYVYVNDISKDVSDAISYRDNRVDQSVQEVHQMIKFEDLYKKTGIQFQKFNTIYQLHNDAKIRERLLSKNSRFLMIPSYLSYLLTGEKYLELTNVSTTGFLDIKSKTISQELLTKIGIQNNIFPNVLKPGELCGYLKSQYSNKHIPVYMVCSHDTASAVLGTPLTKTSIFISSGTWSLVGVELHKPIVTPEAYHHNFTNELGYDGTVDFLKNTMGMFAINELIKDYGRNNEVIEVSKIASFIDGSPKYEGFVDFDDDLFFQPKNMIFKINQYLKMTHQSTPIFKGQVFDCAYQSLALKCALIVDEIKEVTGKEYNKVVIAGGGSQAEILNQYIANATGLTVVTGPSEATVIGNAIVQFISNKQFVSMEEARKVVSNSFASKTYYPKNPEEWKEKLNKYKEIINKENK